MNRRLPASTRHRDPYSSTPTRRLSGCEQEHGHQAGVTDRARRDIERASEYEKIPADDTTIRAVNRDDRAHDQGHEKLAPGYPLGLRSQPTQCATLGGRRGSAPSTPEQRDDGAPHVPVHHGAEWPRGTRRHGPRLADRASSAGTVCKTIRVRSNCALVCRRYRPASGTSSFTMRTDVAASDPPSDSARSSRRRPIRGARGQPHRLRSPIPIHSRTVHWVRWNPMQNEGWSEGNKNPGML